MSIYRSTVWFVKGLKEYTKQGYLNASRSFRPNDLDVDVTGKSFMITGANSGIGKCTALAIAKKGDNIVQPDSAFIARSSYMSQSCGIVHMVCRDSIRGEDARKEITDTTGNQNVFLHLLDMSKPKDIAKFAADFETSGKNLDVLINNAGCMVIIRELTDDGLEKNFATNTLGAHVLTTSLLSVLNKAEKPRVILVTSGGMLVQKLDLKDLQFEKMYPFDGTMAYAQNKRQQVIMTEQYAKNYPNIHCSCMHPGWADTPAVRMSMPSFHAKMKDRLRTPEQGADTLLWLAISDAALQQPSGLFFQDRTSVSKHLPLAWSKSTKQEDEQLMASLDELSKQYSTLS